MMATAPKRIGPKKQKRIDRRISVRKMGYSYRWSKYSKQYRRENPECVRCGEPADCVDHITPITGDEDPKFWDASNHQSLCTSCHSKKTAREANGMDIGRNNYRRR